MPQSGGHTVDLKCGKVDNRLVVPYSPLLCKIFEAHFNIKYASRVRSINYVCKYVFKGPDAAAFEVSDKDEVKLYEVGRYFSSHENSWRLLGNEIHSHHPPVQHLSIHLENHQRVYFKPGEEEIAAKTQPETTHTAFFKLCQSDQFARSLLYSDIPRYYK